jgi:hypothetical protein
LLEISFRGFAVAYGIAVVLFGRKNRISGSRFSGGLGKRDDFDEDILAFHASVIQTKVGYANVDNLAFLRRTSSVHSDFGNLVIGLTNSADFDVPDRPLHGNLLPANREGLTMTRNRLRGSVRFVCPGYSQVEGGTSGVTRGKVTPGNGLAFPDD